MRYSNCHPKKPHHAKGFCSSCYHIKGRDKPSICHPNNPHHGNGLCKTCYNRKYEHTDKRSKYRKTNKYKEYHKSYENHKYKTNINYRLANILRSRMRIALKHKIKTGSSVRDLGCTLEQLKAHLESQFQLGMTWENHGVQGWHVDHIIPLASFNLADRDQLLKACHYTNLQPLWAKDNWSKKDKEGKK